MSIAAVMAGLRYTGVTIRCVIKSIRLFGALVLDSKLRQNQAPTCHASSTDLGGAEKRQNGNITLIHAAVFDWLRATFAGAQQPAGDQDLATIRGR